MKTFDLFIKPVITEKATSFEGEGKYQFFVRKDATKIDISSAFEKIYGVKVIKVNVINTAGKSKSGRTRRPIAKKAEFKKVIISTKGKKTLDITKFKVK